MKQNLQGKISVEQFRRRQAELGRKRREMYLTDEEHKALLEALKELREKTE